MSVDLIAAFSRALEKAQTDRVTSPVTWPPRRLDHTPCEARCSRMVCACEDALCVGYFDNACDHGQTLCEDCRGACEGCRADRADDAGVAYIAVPELDTVPADGDRVVCTACDRGAVLVDQSDAGPLYDPCPVCGGTGAVPYAAVLGGAA